MLPISSSRPVQLMGRMARSFPEGLPDATIVHRIGEIKAWDNADFVAAVKKTGRKKLLVAGISTEVCVRLRRSPPTLHTAIIEHREKMRPP